MNPENLLTQKYIATLDAWSDLHKMKLNEKRQKYNYFNFTKKYQFVTRLKLKGTHIEQVIEAKILGTIVSDTLCWDANVARIIKKCNVRMQLLRQVAKFGADPQIMKLNYIQIIRVVLEGSCQVWDSGLTAKHRRALERIQKLCLWIILPNCSYKEAMNKLSLEDLQTRRTKLTLRFARLHKSEGKIASLFNHNKKSII